MLDYISIYIYNTITILKVFNSTLLDYSKEVILPNKKTGEILKLQYYTYRNLNFIFKENSNGIFYELQIKGSIHYYFNLGIHNGNIMLFDDFVNITNEVITKFNLNPFECVLRPCEYGFNISFEDVDNLPYNCMAESRKLFKQEEKYPFAISGTKNNDYQLKVYSKSFQFKHISDPNTLRVEEKNNRSRSWQRLGINTLNDLLQKDNHKKIYEQFKQRIKQLIVYDEEIKKSALNRTKLNQFSNPNYWRRLIKKGSNNKEYNRKKNELEKLSKNQGSNIKEKLLLVIEKQYLINYNLLTNSNYLVQRVKTYAQYKKSTYAHICIECNSINIYDCNDILQVN